MARLKLKIPHYPKFDNKSWKVLMIDNGFFLYGEWEQALAAAGHTVLSLPVRHRDSAVPWYYRRLTAAIEEFRPDCVFNINFAGFDPEGRLAAMFAALDIPVLFWLIDHPNRFFPAFSESITGLHRLFVIDPEWQQLLFDRFNLKAHLLQLAVTDYYSNFEFSNTPQAEVSIVCPTGIEEMEEFSRFRPDLDRESGDVLLLELATLLSKNSTRRYPEIFSNYQDNKQEIIPFASKEDEQGFEMNVTALADFLYRKKHLNLLLAKEGLVYGDERWQQFLPERPAERILDWPDLETKYSLYRNSKININLSSFFLPATFSRRLLEIPLCGGFVLTDYREAYTEFYQQDAYRYFTTLSGLAKEIDYYLSHPKKRRQLQEQARNHILTRHTYQNRVEFLASFIEEEYLS